ncbi:ABC transporter [Fragilaria crotonensis]|nr:ABC transporter [Fragilaria crotonensis]
MGKGSDLLTRSRLKAILPEYRIDSRSNSGRKPAKIFLVALSSKTGNGKTTALALIERYYDPLEGSVTLDGIDIKEYNVAHLRSLIGYVGQEPTLFATTIAGNIKYGKADATQEEIEEAARLANAHDFITSFPDGYNTQVGDKGAQHSGGQKKRIAIASFLIANPTILLLDEATSALDSESEMLVQDALDNVVAESKRTKIVIDHRLSTIRNAHSIVVMSDGQVVGHFFNLVSKQEKRESENGLGVGLSSNLSNLDDEGATAKIIECMPDDATPHFEFRDVVFAYVSRQRKQVFDGFNVKIKAGETVALVGPSGGGKSTAVAQVERFYDTLQGSVLYKGHDVRSLNVHWYRDQIGDVGQEPTLFNTTIARNIAYGATGATQEEIEEAAKRANVQDIIMSFPDGYNTFCWRPRDAAFGWTEACCHRSCSCEEGAYPRRSYVCPRQRE